MEDARRERWELRRIGELPDPPKLALRRHIQEIKAEERLYFQALAVRILGEQDDRP